MSDMSGHDTDQNPDQEPPFTASIQKFAEDYLGKYNRYLIAKAHMEELKSESDQAEAAMIRFAKQVGFDAKTEITLPNIGKFAIKEKFVANILKDNILTVFAFFKEQGREKEFFELAIRKSKLNEFVKEQIVLAVKTQEKPSFPDGLTVVPLKSVSISQRNPQFGLESEKNDKGESL